MVFYFEVQVIPYYTSSILILLKYRSTFYSSSGNESQPFEAGDGGSSCQPPSKQSGCPSGVTSAGTSDKTPFSSGGGDLYLDQQKGLSSPDTVCVGPSLTTCAAASRCWSLMSLLASSSYGSARVIHRDRIVLVVVVRNDVHHFRPPENRRLMVSKLQSPWRRIMTLVWVNSAPCRGA